MATHRSSRWLALALAILLGGHAWAAEDKKPPADKEPVADPPAIADVLEELAEVEFADTALADVLDYLRARYEIPIVVDNHALEEAGIPIDAKLTINLRNISLRAALGWLLRDRGLDWTVHDEVVLITTPDVAAATLSTLVYDVSDIVPAPLKDEKKADNARETLSALVETVRTSAEPGSWSDTGGPGTVTPFEVGPARMLVVYQNRRGHEAVMLLLDDIAFCADDARHEHDKRSSGAHAKVTRWTRPAQAQPTTVRFARIARP